MAGKSRGEKEDGNRKEEEERGGIFIYILADSYPPSWSSGHKVMVALGYFSAHACSTV